MCLNLSLSISRRLVLSWLLLAVGERRLLVARGAAAAGVRSRRVRCVVVVGRVSVLLVELTDTLAVPCIGKVGQGSLLREVRVSEWSFYTTLWQIFNQLSRKLSCDFFFVSQMLVTLGGSPRCRSRRRRRPRQPGRHRVWQQCLCWFWTTGWPGHRSRWTTGTSKPLSHKVKAEKGKVSIRLKYDDSINFKLTLHFLFLDAVPLFLHEQPAVKPDSHLRRPNLL